MRFKPILLIIVILSASVLVHLPINTQVSAQNITLNDLIITKPANTISNVKPLMSFVQDVSGYTSQHIGSSMTSFQLTLKREGCSSQTFNITIPSTTQTKLMLSTSAIYNDHIYLAYNVGTTNQYNTTSISYTLSGCTFNLSTTNPTWSSGSDNYLQYWTNIPIWISNRVYLIGNAIYNYDNKNIIDTLNIPIISSNHQFSYLRTSTHLFAFVYSSSSGYACSIHLSNYGMSCNTLVSGSLFITSSYIYYPDTNIVYLNMSNGSNSHGIVSYDLSTNVYNLVLTTSSSLFAHSYGGSYIYNLKNSYLVFVPMITTSGVISAIVYFSNQEFKYYPTELQAYNELGAIGNLEVNPYHHVLFANQNMTANLFDDNFNLIASFTLPSSVSTYQLIKFPQGIKYIQLINTSNGQSIIYTKHNFTPTSNHNYIYDQYLTTVVMTPITFSRLDTDANYYYVKVAQNKPYKSMTQYYAKIIDQSSQVTLALRQAQCSYLVLHEINKSTLQESTMNFMVCEDGISKTIEVPNTVNFVYAQDATFKIHKTGSNDLNIGISSNKDINSEVKVIVCDVIDRAMYDFENSTDEGVQITPTDVVITYPALSSNERAMKVYKNASGTYEYVFPLIKINKSVAGNVYIEFSPQDVGGDTKTYTLQFLLRQYNSVKQVISDLTLLSQSNYNDFSTRTYGSYTAYYRTLAIPVLDVNTEYVQLILRFTTSTAPYYNHITQVYLDTNVNQRLCHNYAIFTSMTANTIYTIEDNARSILDKEIIIQYNNQLYSNTFYVNNKSSYSSNSNATSTFSIKIKSVFDEFSTRLTGNTNMSIALFLAFMSIMFFSTVITRNIAVMYAVFILIVSITAYIYSTEILSMPALIILAFMAIALAIYYRYR